MHAARRADEPSVETFDGVALTECGDVLVVVWKSAATEGRYDWFEPRLFAMAQRHASMAILQIILSSSKPPNAALRARVRGSLVRLGPKLRCLVSVPVGDAIWATLVRGIMRGMAILAGQSEVLTVVASMDAAFERLTQDVGPETPSAEALARALDALGAALGVRIHRPRALR